MNYWKREKKGRRKKAERTNFGENVALKNTVSVLLKMEQAEFEKLVVISPFFAII